MPGYGIQCNEETCGGAFGGVLKATPLGDTVGTWIGAGVEVEVVALILVFAIAAVLKTAQGSSTSVDVNILEENPIDELVWHSYDLKPIFVDMPALQS